MMMRHIRLRLYRDQQSLLWFLLAQILLGALCWRRYGTSLQLEESDKLNTVRRSASTLPVVITDNDVGTTTTFQLDNDPQTSILEAKYSLVGLHLPEEDIQGDSYEGVNATFCPVDWSLQKSKPNIVPRYINVIKASKECNSSTSVRVDFADMVRRARHHDGLDSTNVNLLPLSGFIYHVSRCGSTLTANMITAAKPESHRLYSEPTPLRWALESNHTQLVKDVLYMLRRSNDAREERVFVKLKSSDVKDIHLMPPEVPWIFLYRDPLEVVASHYVPTEDVKSIPCLYTWDEPHPVTIQLAEKHGVDMELMKQAEFCALNLASMCYAALQEHTINPGRFFNYNTLPDSVWETILPNHFGVPLDSDDIERMKAISGVYSKGPTDRTDWMENQAKKAKRAPHRLRKAVQKFMIPYYLQMEELTN